MAEFLETESAVRAERSWCWAVAREGDEWMDKRGVREEVRRLSLEGLKDGEEMVGRIVKWVGAEEDGEEDEEED